MQHSEGARQSIDALLQRDDVAIRRRVLDEYVERGLWTDKSAVDYLDQHVRERPEAVCLIDEDGERYTFRQFDEITDHFALHLLELGFKPGDFLGLQLPTWSEFFIAMMGCIKVKVLPVNFHLTYRQHELTDILGRTHARGLVVPARFHHFDYEPLAHEVAKHLPALQHVIVARGPCSTDSIPFGRLTAPIVGADKRVLEPLRPNGFDPLLTLVSSGTTGKPKLVMHIHNTSLYPGRAYKEMLGLSAADRWAVIGPVGHSTSVSQLFWCMLYQGSPIALLSTWNAARACDLFEREGITHAIGATPLYADILDLPDIRSRALQLKLLVYGGAPMPASLVVRLHETFGCDIVPFYGYSEGTGHTTCRPGTAVEVVASKVGMPLPNAEVRLVAEDGSEPPLGVPGEFWARGPNIAVGYYADPERTQQLLTEDGWFKSGDMLSLDEEGFYQYSARMDDVINRGGQKIDPKEIEDLLFTHPSVKDAVLVGVPDRRLGAIPCAVIVPQPGESVTLEDLRSFLEAKGVAKWKWPMRLQLRESIPVNPSGKIMRFALRDEVAAQLTDEVRRASAT